MHRGLLCCELHEDEQPRGAKARCCVLLGLALARVPIMGDWEVDWVWALWWTVVAGVGFMLLLLSRGKGVVLPSANDK